MSDASGEDFETRAFNVRCPNCRLPIELLPNAELSSIDCPSCGSNFSLVNDDNTTRDALSVKELGQFKLVERLGAGAFGTVWKAYDTELDRTVAVKIPRRGQLEPAQEEQFFREARSAAQLSHSHIVSVYEVGRQAETIYIVSDFIRGVSLAELIVDRQLTQREVVEMGVKLADALHHAHERGVIHRDIKPQNVMIDDAGEPHLMDFGLAKRDAGEVTMTLDGAVLGTPAYMSPEQARGESHRVDRTTDVYSLGVLLFQMLTGELPFRGTTRMLLHKVINNDAPGLRQFNSSIPRDLETIALKCLEKEPDRRYPSTEAVGCELERFLAGKPILARPISRAGKTWRWAKRNHEVAILYSALVLGSIAVAIVATYRSGLLRKANEQINAEISRAEAQEFLAMQRVKEASKALFNFGVSEYANHRLHNGVEQLLRAWNLRAEDDPLKPAYGRVLADRLTRGGRLIAILTDTNGDSSVAFSPNGEHLAIATGDTVHLFQSDTGQRRGELPHGNSIIQTVRFTSDGSRILTLAEDNTIRLWDSETHQLVGKPMMHPRRVLSFASSSDGNLIAASTTAKLSYVWNSDTGFQSAQLIKHKGKAIDVDLLVPSLAVDASATKVATASFNGIRLWDAKTCKPLGSLMQLESVSYLIALRGTDLSNLRAGELPVLFSPDGSKLAAATPVDSVWLWDTKSGDPIGGPLPHEGQVSRLAFNRDSTRLTSASEKTAKVWSTETGEQVHIHPLRHPEPIELLTFCPDGEVVVTASGGVFHHWNAKAKRLIRLPQSYDKLSESVTLCPTGKKFIAASSRARLLDMGVNAHQKVTTEYDANLTSMTFDEQRDRDLDTDNRSGEASRSGPEKSKKVFSQCGCIEAVIDDKQVIRFRDINSGQPVGTEIRFRGNVSAIALNASATQLAIGAEKAVRVWDASTGVPVGEEMLHEAKITQLAFSSDGKTLKTTTEKTDRIWKLPTPGSKDIPRLVKQLAPRRDP